MCFSGQLTLIVDLKYNIGTEDPLTVRSEVKGQRNEHSGKLQRQGNRAMLFIKTLKGGCAKWT